MKLRKTLPTIILFSVISFSVSAQNRPPEVSNVIFSQRTDGSFIVDVFYDVNDPDGDAMTVTMQASSDNGATWDFSCNSITGDVGAGITSGIQKHIEWNFGAEHSQTFGDQFKIKIIADDGGFNTGIPCPGEPTVLYEGITYNTVLIDTQCWLRENINVGTRIDGSQEQTNNVPTNFIEKYCYDNNEANCTTYGGLYQWNEALQYATNEGVQGICPDGWHIPTLAEFQTLSSAVGGDGNALKREDQGSGGGQGTNTSGFSALLAGVSYDDGYFYYLGYGAGFWSSTEYDASRAYYLILYYTNSDVRLDYYYEEFGFSVRCVKDN